MDGIGKRLKKCRENAGLKQEELAELADLSCNYLSAIERDVKTPKLETFVHLVNVLGVSSDEVLADVLEIGFQIRCSEMEEKLKSLPSKERKKILRVIDVLIEESEK